MEKKLTFFNFYIWKWSVNFAVSKTNIIICETENDNPFLENISVFDFYDYGQCNWLCQVFWDSKIRIKVMEDDRNKKNTRLNLLSRLKVTSASQTSDDAKIIINNHSP